IGGGASGRSAPYVAVMKSITDCGARNAIRQTPPGRGSSVACAPIHCTILRGSVKKPKTISGGAAIRTSCSVTSVSAGVAGIGSALLVLGRLLEALQTGRYDLGEEAVQVGQPLWAHAVQATRAVAALADQARLPEHLEVLGDRGLGDGEARGDLAGTSLAGGQQAQDLSPRRLRDRFENLH